MDGVIFLVVIAIIHAVVLFFDVFFKSCMHYPYDAFMKNTGLTVKLLRIDWRTTALNRSIVKWGSSYRRILTQSFNLGVIATLLLLPIGISLLLVTIFRSEWYEKGEQKQFGGPRIELLLPGLNLPLDEIGYYISSFAITATVHEFGHAMAAVIEDVPVTGVGLQIYFCLPITYTELSTENLNLLKPFRKMRILCAGIWHNILLAAISYLTLSSLGILFQPFYFVQEGVIVTDVNFKSPLVGEKGIFANDVITGINKCRVTDVHTWYTCLQESARGKPGYCVSSDYIRLNDESEPMMHGPDGIIQCCDATNLKLACFEYIDDVNNDEPLEIPQHMCLNIRNTVESSTSYCSISCDDGFCIKPLLNNATTILDINRKGRQNVLYIGRPSDVYFTIRVSSYVPRNTYLRSTLADGILLLLKYTTVFSFGLGVINAIPCYGLDGMHIINTMFGSILASKVSDRSQRELIAFLTTCLGTVLFLVSILKVIWSSLWYR